MVINSQVFLFIYSDCVSGVFYVFFDFKIDWLGNWQIPKNQISNNLRTI